ncbi:MAG TPA: PRC-barrel domain-containing protein [Solirubrobacterales bacterium]|nr:PRC-barrel domain-containing protein [Solirubrobacterales bacterium]
MEDLGQPSSYHALAPGVPVFSSDGEKLGEVERVLADLDAGVFDGIVFDTSALPGGHRFVDGPEVDAIYDLGVVLKITAAEAAELKAPTANPGSISVKAGDLGSGSRGGLRRAWDRLTGRG